MTWDSWWHTNMNLVIDHTNNEGEKGKNKEDDQKDQKDQNQSCGDAKQARHNENRGKGTGSQLARVQCIPLDVIDNHIRKIAK